MQLTDTQTQLLEQLVALPLLMPDDFVARWTMSYREISQICCCSTSTVEHWFSTGAGRRAPAQCYQKLLAIADFLLTNVDAIHYWQQLWE
ncbi:MAG: helix-turn-helix domain-containing protein [Lyngbya sp. HA4199-MV5]|jgi:DNA-directed RNA polymerase specialized sigma24 family protein|nr:helix-turn-helix domain-containing protein [Lyngbya sp. HA4199-MV5]